MNMMALSKETKQGIRQALLVGKTSRTIAAEYKVSHTTVNAIRKESTQKLTCSKGGRPRIFDERYRRQICRAITSGRADTAVDLNKLFSGNGGTRTACPQTFRNILREAGLKSSVKIKKPKLCRQHIKARYDFAIQHKDWTEVDWARVIFSDETKINRLGSDGRRWVWKRTNKVLSQHDVKETQKFGGGSLMFWGCISVNGAGFGCRVDGRMDSALYLEILQGEFMQSIGLFGKSVQDIIFQQDNDPKHKSRLVMNWIEGVGIQLLDWPAYSPDLNPIEHIWVCLKRKLADYETTPESMHELWVRIEKEWESITPDLCRHLIESMPRRIAAVIAARGGYTKY